MDTRSPGHTTEPAPVQPRTSAPDATDGRDGVAGGRGAPEWQTRGRRGLSGPSGRRPRPPGTCSAAPSLPSRKEECGCFLKEKKTLLPLNLRHFPRARKRAWGAGAPRSLSDAPRRAPALRPEHAHTLASVLRPASVWGEPEARASPSGVPACAAKAQGGFEKSPRPLPAPPPPRAHSAETPFTALRWRSLSAGSHLPSFSRSPKRVPTSGWGAPGPPPPASGTGGSPTPSGRGTRSFRSSECEVPAGRVPLLS